MTEEVGRAVLPNGAKQARQPKLVMAAWLADVIVLLGEGR
jgi:hypothetical protein